MDNEQVPQATRGYLPQLVLDDQTEEAFGHDHDHLSDEGSVKYKNSEDKDVGMSFVETRQNHQHLEQLDGDGPQTTQPTSTVEPDDDIKKQRRINTEEDQSRDCCDCRDSTDCGDCDDCGNCDDCGVCRDCGDCGDCCDHGDCRDCCEWGDIGDLGDCNLDCCDGGDDCTIL